MSMEYEYDALVIGAGVIGCAVSRELSKYELKVALVEKESDVCGGASKANSGVLHSGIYSAPGSHKARLCVQGNDLFSNFTQEVGVELQRIGKLVVARNDQEIDELEKLKEVGDEIGILGLKLIDEEEMMKLEPNIKGQSALMVPSAGIVSPYMLTIALAENAWENNAKIFLNYKVIDISQKKDHFEVKTDNISFRTRWVINSAGLYCDTIANMLGIDKHKVYPCRGEYLILDKSYKNLINHLIYPPPENGSGGLGVHLTPTMEGNILIGPTAIYIDEKEDIRTTNEAMDILIKGAENFLKQLPENAYIQSYAGVRCKLIPQGSETSGDFVIEEDDKVEGCINLMGIESPGLSASPAIALKVVDIIKCKEDLKPKENYKTRTYQSRFHKQDFQGKDRLIESNPKHGHIICRCENVTEQEINCALDNPLGVKTLAGIKYRSRATMGRCQGGFCRARVIQIMEDRYKMGIEDITFRGGDSRLFIGKTKDLRKHDTEES